MWDVFVSYSHKDVATMYHVRDTLKNYGLQVWSDENLKPGTPSWESAVGDAIENTHCLIVLMSPDSKKSEWVGREISHARNHGLHIIPLLAHGEVRDAIPFSLIDYQRIDIRFQSDKALELLVDIVRSYISTRTASQPINIPEAIKPQLHSPGMVEIDADEVYDVLSEEDRFNGLPTISAVKIIPFGELVDFHRIESIPQSKQNPGKYPLYSVTGIQSYIDTYQFDGEYLIVPNIISASSPVGFTAKGRFSATSSVFVVTPNQKILPDYLVWTLQHMNLHQYKSGTIPRVSKRDLSNLPVPVPALDEQQRFISYMRQVQARADEIKALYQEATIELEALMPSILAHAFQGKM